jgi:hypothetical protein
MRVQPCLSQGCREYYEQSVGITRLRGKTNVHEGGSSIDPEAARTRMAKTDVTWYMYMSQILAQNVRLGVRWGWLRELQ